MSTSGHLKFQGTNRATFVGTTSNIMFDTTTTSLGIGVTGTDHPSSNLYITGNAYVSSNIAVGGVLTMGTVNVVARHDLEAVTATGNITPLTIQFTNPTTSLVASGNVVVTGNVTADHFVGDGSNITGISSTLQAITDSGPGANVTSNTVQFTNATTSLVASGNVVVTGNVTADHFVGDGSNITGISSTLQAITDSGPGANVTSNTIQFTNATTSLVASGNVGIGTTSPAKPLHIEHYGSQIGDFEGIRIANHATNLHATSRPAYELVVSDIDAGTGLGNGKFSIGYRGNTTASRTDRLVIDNSGNVGVGTTTPYTPFEIYTNVGGNSGGGMRIHHVTGSPRLDFVRGGSYRSPNTSVFGASNYADWSIGTGGANFRITKQLTTENSGNEATVMQIQHNGPILSQLSTGWTGNNPNSGDGDNYTASSLYRDYSSWVSIFKSGWVDTASGWGTFWAGNSGAAYRRESGDNNPNEYVFVGDGNKRFTFELNNGQAYFDAGLSQNNYDYAEYFEWEDGNPDNEDRRGYSVVLGENGKIKKATSDDEPNDIFGIVSGTSSIVGDAACYDWHGKYEVDEWGSRVTDEVYQLTWTTEEGKNHSYDEDRVPEGITVPDDVSRRLHNRERITPGYDDTAVYIPRDKRKEWCPVGLVGKVRLRDGCPTNPNWRYMKTVAGKQLWLIR